MTPRDSMRYYKSFLRTGMLSMTPQTGHVKAWVGGVNFKHFQYDMVKQGKRQVGSTFKPFVYAAAIDQLHLSPCDTFPKSQITIEALKYGNMKPWAPKNSGGNYGGFETIGKYLKKYLNREKFNFLVTTEETNVDDKEQIEYYENKLKDDKFKVEQERQKDFKAMYQEWVDYDIKTIEEYNDIENRYSIGR